MIKIIALDLDGTLLNSNKQLTERNRKALEDAAAAGVYVVPTTGRLAAGLTPEIRNLPFLQYVIAVNGAVVSDVKNNLTLTKNEITKEGALEILDVLKDYPGVYDCYIDGFGYMNSDMLADLRPYTIDENQFKLVSGTRKGVEDLAAYVKNLEGGVQKSQIMFRSNADREKYLPEIRAKLPNCLCTCSYSNNIEINSLEAHKGAGLKFLCDYLHIPMEEAMSFGDGSNDVTMLEMAGIGVAMANADDEVKSYANLIAPSCDEDGVAQIIEKYVLNR